MITNKKKRKKSLIKDSLSYVSFIGLTIIFSAFGWIEIIDDSIMNNFGKILVISLITWGSTYLLYGLIMTISLKHTSPVIIFGSIWAVGILSAFKITPYVLPDQWFTFSNKAEWVLLMGFLYAAVMIIRKWRSIMDFINGYVIYEDRRSERQ